ncbi:MAG: erythromycin esterase family protein [Gemmatimonadaceae bacterium]|nr:erythromycin esterase family protein [Gemmatimonadaceae bacterium]
MGVRRACAFLTCANALMVPASRRASALLSLITPVLLSGCLSESLIKQPELQVLPGAPAGWTGTASTPGVGTTVSDRKSGTTAAYLSNAFQLQLGNFTIVQSIKADNYRGKRVRLSAWVKPRNVSSVSVSGLFMRVDGPGNVLAYDNMATRMVFGYGNWRQVSIVLDVADNAIGISFGAQFQATNTLLIDDITLEVVGTDVQSTNTLSAPAAGTLDSAGTVAIYERRAASPTNLDFEGLPAITAETSTWIAQNSSTLSTTDPAAAFTDLEPLRAMVGSAQLVGLGEATHGTKEFFRLKHRMLRFLVTEMGFTTFAIEATSPEADDLNRYVLTGVGNPAVLLSRLYFWTWNTQEVADLITWMRQWNTTAPVAQRVSFRGFDMQSPGASMDSVTSFIHRVAPNYDVDILNWYQCMQIFRNRGATEGRPRSEYAAQPADSRAFCAEGINDAVELVRTRGAGAPDLQAAVHHARLVQQFESVISTSNQTLSNQRRDAFMAENVTWLRDQSPAGARMVLWAHNEHITRQPGAMGAQLGIDYGSDYRPLGFSFGRGAFNAILQQGATAGTLQSHTVQLVPVRSLEDAFLSTTIPMLLLDARKLLTGGNAAQPLRGPIATRTIGTLYNPSTEASYFPLRVLPYDFDLMIFVRDGTATTLLPFVN